MPLPLSAILEAITGEFARASMGSDAYRGHLARIYAKHPLLNGMEPSRVRVREAAVSIPLAFHAADPEKIEDYGLTPAQIREMLPPDLDGSARSMVAERIHAELERTRKNRLLNANLRRDLGRVFKAVMAEAGHQGELRDEGVERLRRDFAARPNKELSAEFAFTAEELAAVDPSRIFRIDIKMDVD